MFFSFERKRQILYVMGFAGSGKTTLVKAFSEYLNSQGENVAIVNLDPGVERLPYKPDFDVRSIVKLSDIMKREGLGPNGGLIRAVEIVVDNLNDVVDHIRELLVDSDWMLIDTTGQLELFAFRDLGEKLVNMLRGHLNVGIFLIDSSSITKPSDIVMMQLVSLAIQYKLGIDVIPVLNKIDMSRIPVKDFVEELFFDPDKFKKKLDQMEATLLTDLAFELIDVIVRYLPATRVIAISSKNKENFDELYSVLHEVYCSCGDLT